MSCYPVESCFLIGRFINRLYFYLKERSKRLPEQKAVVKSFVFFPAAQSPQIKMIDVITENIGQMGIAVFHVLAAAHCFAPVSGLESRKMKTAIFDFILSHQWRNPSWEATGSK